MFGKKKIVYINGMSCNHCAKRVEDGLKSINGVKSVKVDLNDKNAKITYKDVVDNSEIEEVINDLGFEFNGVRDE